MASSATTVKAFFKRKSVKYGLPFLICVLGGSFGLKEFAQLRYTFSKKSLVKREDIKSAGIDMNDPKESTIEVQYEKLKTMDIDNWEQVRGPRPWEENVSS
ncbi:cytochrome c oxidase assembly protein COX16 homolog, mitochondrial [Atheta coriaria]|uniref:cytochrome c oxidase assembly protein COX16 homolog, mitochondrial n=1 Tax=Dalotia coriaria TaxID=877792 RepID=UPI0031F36133